MTLRQFHISQDIGAGNDKKDVAGLLIAGHGIGKGLFGFYQIAFGPVGKSQERRRGPAPEVILLRQKVERLPGIFYSAGHIAEGQRMIGAGGGDAPRQIVKFFFIGDDETSCSRLRSVSRHCSASAAVSLRPPARLCPARPRHSQR